MNATLRTIQDTVPNRELVQTWTKLVESPNKELKNAVQDELLSKDCLILKSAEAAFQACDGEALIHFCDSVKRFVEEIEDVVPHGILRQLKVRVHLINSLATAFQKAPKEEQFKKK